MARFILTLITMIMFACPGTVFSKDYTEIDAPTLKEMMTTDDVLVVFPLSKIEYNDKHITDSVLIPLNDLKNGLPADKNKKLAFYCLGIKCTASWRAAEKAVKLGYTNVYAFREGLPAWVSAGYSTTTIEALPTVKIKNVTTDELMKELYINPDIVLLDVRLQVDADKFWIEHPNRLHIPVDEMSDRFAEIPKDKILYVICLKGKRSPTVARFLSNKGFNEGYSIQGGMEKWVLEGKPIKTKLS